MEPWYPLFPTHDQAQQESSTSPSLDRKKVEVSPAAQETIFPWETWDLDLARILKETWVVGT